MQFYSKPDEEKPHTQPDTETIELRLPTGTDKDRETYHPEDFQDDDGNNLSIGWYWWACFPGCLPDGEPQGPFDTEALAIADARSD